MSSFATLAQLGLPLVMGVGAILAWIVSRRSNGAVTEKPAWRDDSLDDWRREREEARETERTTRAANPPEGPHAGESAERHTRMGG
jgi:hypothetical protein